jgi:hypothetical protein
VGGTRAREICALILRDWRFSDEKEEGHLAVKVFYLSVMFFSSCLASGSGSNCSCMSGFFLQSFRLRSRLFRHVLAFRLFVLVSNIGYTYSCNFTPSRICTYVFGTSFLCAPSFTLITRPKSLRYHSAYVFLFPAGVSGLSISMSQITHGRGEVHILNITVSGSKQHYSLFGCRVRMSCRRGRGLMSSWGCEAGGLT